MLFFIGGVYMDKVLRDYEDYHFGDKSFIFEREGKSYLGSQPDLELRGYKDRVELDIRGENHKLYLDSLNYLENFLKSLEDMDVLAVGGFTYEYKNYRDRDYEDGDFPGYVFMIFTSYDVYSGGNYRSVGRERSRRKIEGLEDFSLATRSPVDEKNFKNNVQKILSIIDEDLAQVVISDRQVYGYEGDDYILYKKIRDLNPSPYMYYLNFGDFKLLGASPEMLFKVEDGMVFTSPIAGTRPRGSTDQELRENIEELLEDKKELREHDMLLDLSREDMLKVSDQIELLANKEIQVFSHVIHLRSELRGSLKEGLGLEDLFKVFFPAGTVSGKTRKEAMELIAALEREPRGFYGGSVGLMDSKGNMDFAIAIRTMILKDSKAYVQGGAGIVRGSEVDREYEEILNKMRVLDEVLGGIR